MKIKKIEEFIKDEELGFHTISAADLEEYISHTEPKEEDFVLIECGGKKYEVARVKAFIDDNTGQKHFIIYCEDEDVSKIYNKISVSWNM